MCIEKADPLISGQLSSLQLQKDVILITFHSRAFSLSIKRIRRNKLFEANFTV